MEVISSIENLLPSCPIEFIFVVLDFSDLRLEGAVDQVTNLSTSFSHLVHKVASLEDTKSILVTHCLAVNAASATVDVCEVLDTLVAHKETANTLVPVFLASRALSGSS